MDEEDAIEHLDELLAESKDGLLEECLPFSLEAVSNFPWSASLWYLRGIALERSETPAQEVRACFEQAIEIDPGHAEANQELGYLLDVYFDHWEYAERCFRRAVSLGCGDESVLGLARVMAQAGRPEEAIRILDETNWSPQFGEDATKLRNEVLDGIWDHRR